MIVPLVRFTANIIRNKYVIITSKLRCLLGCVQALFCNWDFERWPKNVKTRIVITRQQLLSWSNVGPMSGRQCRRWAILHLALDPCLIYDTGKQSNLYCSSGPALVRPKVRHIEVRARRSGRPEVRLVEVQTRSENKTQHGRRLYRTWQRSHTCWVND